MKRVKKPVFFVVALLILALVYTSLFGVYGQRGDFKETYICLLYTSDAADE